MPCNYPIQAYRLGDRFGKSDRIVFAVTKGMNVLTEFKVACGVCIGCRLERSRQWALRCVHEAQLYEQNCFITLTYNDEHLPDNKDLDYSHFQKFMKRLRKKFGAYLPTKRHQGPIRKIRFFMCGEYGENFRRPHFHACLFNIDFDDRVYFKTTASGAKIYTSKTLDSLWMDRSGNSIGYATVGVLNFDSAGYVARYVMKKGYGHGSELEYETIDLETGEVNYQQKEFNRMSLKPGIGTGFYEKYKTDMFPHDICVINGVATKPPRFYFKKYKEENPLQHEEVLFKREQKAAVNAADNIPERLEVKEEVLKAKIRSLKRELV